MSEMASLKAKLGWAPALRPTRYGGVSGVSVEDDLPRGVLRVEFAFEGWEGTY